MKQESFSDMEYRCRKKKTKREEFLEIMDEIIPWDECHPVWERTVFDGQTLCPDCLSEQTTTKVIWNI